MLQPLAFDWILFSLTLGGLLFFGICYALLVNWMARNRVNGQTAYMVVGGVAFALITAIPTFGLFTVAIFFSYFAACGLPMVIEYGLRVHQERRMDEETAKRLAREAIGNDEQA